MPEKSLTLGQAIDTIIDALSALPPESRTTAIETARNHLGITLSQDTRDSRIRVPTTDATRKTDPPAPSPKHESSVRDIRSFKEQKKPTSAQQMACLVAYYLQELAPTDERKMKVSTADLDKYFKQAQFKLPSDIGQVLKNGKKAGYFDAADRGHYKLNAVGYNLVSHGLPASHKP